MILAVVPAAGQSRRMGGEPKQLLPFAGTTIIGHIVDELSRSCIDEIRVVVGHQSEEICQALTTRPVQIVGNPDYQRTDMLASIRCGLTNPPANCRAVLIALGDQPSITAELINAMVDCLITNNRGIIVPSYQGQRGHPLLLDYRYCEEILTNHSQVGLRGLLAAHADDVFELPVSSAAVLSDIDTPEDYQRELSHTLVKQ